MNKLKQYTTSQTAIESRASQKGRSQDLLRRRDQKLATRFYYFTSICGLEYRQTIDHLYEEFDISEKAIVTRLRTSQQFLNELFNQQPPLHLLRKKYPYLVF